MFFRSKTAEKQVLGLVLMSCEHIFGLLVMEISENLSRGINAFHGERVQGVSTFTSSILYFRFKILLKNALKDAYCFLAKPVFFFCLE